MNKTFIEALKHRRSYYFIDDKTNVTAEQVHSLVKTAVKHVPSAYNSQSARVVILFEKEHQKFWDTTKEILLEKIGEERFPAIEKKLNSFAAGNGTLLFFEDQSTVHALEEKFLSYQANFQPRSLQSSGMLQFAIWTMLEDLGLGASLQHYNPLVDKKVSETWNIPSSWKLMAQMPFGNPTAEPGEKDYLDLEKRVLFFD